MASALAYTALAYVAMDQTKPKKPKKGPVVPVPDEQLIEQQQRRDRRDRTASGRQSTILSDGLG